MKSSFTPILLSACRVAPVARTGSRMASGVLDRVMVGRLRLKMAPRAAVAWVGVWTVYSLAMLGYFAYDAGWVASLCGVR